MNAAVNNSGRIKNVELRHVVLGSISALYLLLGAWLAYQDRVTAVTVCVAAGLLLLLVGNLDKLEHIKGLGVEAKMRQWDQRLNEADELLNHMRNLSRVMGQMTFDTLSRTGRWVGPPSRATSLEIAKTLEGHMQVIGISEEEIDTAMAPWHRLNLAEIAYPVLEAIRETLSQLVTLLDGQLQTYIPDRNEYQNIVARRQEYGEQLAQLSKRWEADTFDFVLHAEEIISSLSNVPEDLIADLLEKTAQDRRAAVYYAKNRRFLSESEWLAGQPAYN